MYKGDNIPTKFQNRSIMEISLFPHPTPLAVTISVFFLLSPVGRIDHGHHDGKAVKFKALTDAVVMNKAVASALKMANKGKYFDPLDFILMDFGETWDCSHLSVTQIYISEIDLGTF